MSGNAMDEKTLRRLQLTQLEIMKAADRICRENGIPYSLYGGTLLGAARHQGFIPWDDDLDICMLREDYDRFIRAWQSQDIEDYLLENIDTNSSFTQSFTKIRKRNTVFMQPFETDVDYHIGIFIDIFPLDRVPNGTFKRKMQMLSACFYQLYVRDYPDNSGRLSRLCTKALLAATPKRLYPKCIRFFYKRFTKYNGDRNLKCADFSVVRTMKNLLPHDIFDSMVDLPFEDTEFMAFAGWDTSLRVSYGDYMQLPPVEQRKPGHNPIRVEFE